MLHSLSNQHSIENSALEAMTHIRDKAPPEGERTWLEVAEEGVHVHVHVYIHVIFFVCKGWKKRKQSFSGAHIISPEPTFMS